MKCPVCEVANLAITERQGNLCAGWQLPLIHRVWKNHQAVNQRRSQTRNQVSVPLSVRQSQDLANFSNLLIVMVGGTGIEPVTPAV